MQTSQAGLDFIAKNEGLSLKVYNDNGKPCVGYGHDLLPGESYPDGITTLQARLLLEKDVTLRDALMAHLVPPNCTQNQWDACSDFCYNLGIHSLQIMLAHGWDQFPTQAVLWDHVNGVENAGLKARRAAEVALFMS
jgi:GH24 family phage-related lysozyme (muramidase)